MPSSEEVSVGSRCSAGSYEALLRSQSRTVASREPVTTRLSSTWRQRTDAVWPSRKPIQRPRLRSQTLTVSSREAVTRVPKGMSKSIAVMVSVWAESVLRLLPDSRCSCRIGSDLRVLKLGRFFFEDFGEGSFAYMDSDMKEASMASASGVAGRSSSRAGVCFIASCSSNSSCISSI